MSGAFMWWRVEGANMDAVRDLIPDLRAATEAAAIAKHMRGVDAGMARPRMVPP